MEHLSFLTPELMGIVITFIIAIFGGSTKYTQIKTKLNGISNVIKEINKALEDDKISDAEAKNIMKLLKGLVI